MSCPVKSEVQDFKAGLTPEQREVISEIRQRLESWAEGYTPLGVTKLAKHWLREMERVGLK